MGSRLPGESWSRDEGSGLNARTAKTTRTALKTNLSLHVSEWICAARLSDDRRWPILFARGQPQSADCPQRGFRRLGRVQRSPIRSAAPEDHHGWTQLRRARNIRILPHSFSELAADWNSIQDI